MNEKWKKIREKYWPPGKDQLLILVLLGLLLAVIAIPVEKKETDREKTVQTSEDPGNGAGEAAVSTDYESRMEQKLADLLSQVEGVGRVQVMLTLEGTGEKKVEKDKSSSADTIQEETVYEEYGGSERSPYVISESTPQVEGVLVIAEGGDDSRVKQEILEAAQALFGVEPHKIKIMKMEGTK